MSDEDKNNASSTSSVESSTDRTSKKTFANLAADAAKADASGEVPFQNLNTSTNTSTLWDILKITFDISFCVDNKIASVKNIQECFRNSKKTGNWGVLKTAVSGYYVIVYNEQDLSGRWYSDVCEGNEFNYIRYPHNDNIKEFHKAISSIRPNLVNESQEVVMMVITTIDNKKHDNRMYEFFHVLIGNNNNGDPFISRDDVNKYIPWREMKGIELEYC